MSSSRQKRLESLKKRSVDLQSRKIARRFGVSRIRGIQTNCSQCGHKPGFHKCCPVDGCEVTAFTPAGIDLLFGFREIEPNLIIPQSRCYKHR